MFLKVIYTKLTLLYIIAPAIIVFMFSFYFFFISTRDDNIAIRFLIKELSEFSYTNKIDVEIINAGQINVNLPEVYGDAQKVLVNEKTSKYTINFETQKVKSIQNNSELNFMDFNKNNNPFFDFSIWEEELNENDYKVVDNGSTWLFTFDSERLTQKYIALLAANVSDLVDRDLGAQEIQISSTATKFGGKIIFKIEVDKSKKQINRISIEADKEIIVAFELKGKGIEHLKSTYSELGRQVPRFEGTYDFKNLKTTWQISNIEVKPGKSWPDNELELFLAEQLEMELF